MINLQHGALQQDFKVPNIIQNGNSNFQQKNAIGVYVYKPYYISENFHYYYKEYCKDELFEDVLDFACHLFKCIAKVSEELGKEYNEIELKQYFEQLRKVQDPTGNRFYVPFIFHPKREEILGFLKDEFKLNQTKTEKLREIIFNFAIRSFIENKFNYGFVKKIFGHIQNLKTIYENHFNQMESTFEKTRDSFKENENILKEFEIIHKKQIEEQKKVFLEKVPFSKIIEDDGFEPIKNEMFPDLFRKGRPQTRAFNDLIIELYHLIDSNKPYMPFIQRVITEISLINPDYFERTETSESAVRKKIKEQKRKNEPSLACT